MICLPQTLVRSTILWPWQQETYSTLWMVMWALTQLVKGSSPSCSVSVRKTIHFPSLKVLSIHQLSLTCYFQTTLTWLVQISNESTNLVVGVRSLGAVESPQMLQCLRWSQLWMKKCANSTVITNYIYIYISSMF